MASVPREFPATRSLPCCVCVKQCCELFASHPNQRLAQGNRFPWEFTFIQYLGCTRGTPATPSQQRRKARAGARPGRGHPLLSIYHSMVRLPRETPSINAGTPSLMLESRSTAKWITSTQASHSQSMQICHFLWDSLTDSNYKSGPGK